MKRSQARNWELTWEIAKTDFKLRYHGSVLGVVWMVLKPLLLFAILSTVFSHAFGSTVARYPLKVLTGVVLWTYFADGTSAGLQSLLAKGHLLAKVRLSPWVVVFASVIQTTGIFLLNVLIALLFFLGSGVVPNAWSFLRFSLQVLYLTGLIVGFSLLTAPWYVRYRDLKPAWEVLLTIGFYLTPIIYPLSAIPDRYRSLIALNPLTPIVERATTALLGGEETPAAASAISPGVAVVLIILAGFFVFRRSAQYAPEHL